MEKQDIEANKEKSWKNRMSGSRLIHSIFKRKKDMKTIILISLIAGCFAIVMAAINQLAIIAKRHRCADSYLF